MKKTGKIILSICFLCCFFLQVKPQGISAQEETLQVESKYVTIYSLNEHSAIYEKKAHEQMYPASLTKIMTTLVALEHIDDLHKEVVLGKDIFEGLEEEGASVAGYNIDDRAQLIDLLYGTMLPSGADAARAVAKYVAGSEEAFVKLMNEKAAALKLEHTHFMNTTGLHHNNHYSTAADIVKILETALKNKTFYEIFTADEYTSADGTMHFTHTKQSIMEILQYDSHLLVGSKTGYTLEGGLCLASLMNVDGADYITVTGYAGNDFSTMQHYKDANTIRNYIHDQYETKTVYHANDPIRIVPVRYGATDEIQTVLHDDITMLVKKGEKLDESLIMDTVIAPVDTEEAIAQFQLSSPSIKAKHVFPLYAQEPVKRNWIDYTLHAWWFYTLVILFAILTLIFFIGKPRIVRTYRRFKRYRLRKRQRKMRR